MFSWLKRFSEWLSMSVLGLDGSSHFAKAFSFFIDDTLKIFILLTFISLLMGVVNAYFPVEKLRYYLSTHHFFGLEYIVSSCLGAVTPFCSCSSVPLFLGFVRGGIPLGITFSFLITSPLVNEVAIIMFFGFFGWKMAVAYMVSGILLGALAGWILGLLNLQRLLSPWAKAVSREHSVVLLKPESPPLTLRERVSDIFLMTTDTLKRVMPYVVIGVALGAAMHGYVPDTFFNKYLSGKQWWTVPMAVVSAIPVYANAAAITPVIQILIAKGIPIGTSMAFMMGTVGLSLPEAILLKRAMSIKLIIVFFGVVGCLIMLIGILFNNIF